MNYISCIVRILEIPRIKLTYNKIPVIKFKVEIAGARYKQTNIIVDAKIWGDLTYELLNYYRMNDYLLIECYLSQDYTLPLNTVLKYKKNTTITIFHIYPYFNLF